MEEERNHLKHTLTLTHTIDHSSQLFSYSYTLSVTRIQLDLDSNFNLSHSEFENLICFESVPFCKCNPSLQLMCISNSLCLHDHLRIGATSISIQLRILPVLLCCSVCEWRTLELTRYNLISCKRRMSGSLSVVGTASGANWSTIRSTVACPNSSRPNSLSGRWLWLVDRAVEPAGMIIFFSLLPPLRTNEVSTCASDDYQSHCEQQW